MNNANGTVINDAAVPPANFTYLLNRDSVRNFYQIVKFRQDIQAGHSISWTASGSSGGFFFPITQIGITNENLPGGTSTKDIQLIQAQGNIPIMLIVGSKPASFNSNISVPANTGRPTTRQLCADTAYGDNHISNIDITVSVPNSRTQNWRYDVVMQNQSPLGIAALTSRGVLQKEAVYNKKFQRTGGNFDLVFNDIDQWSCLTYMETQQALPIGYVTPGGNDINGSVLYGGHSILYSGQQTAFNVGLHNQLQIYFLQMTGFFSNGIDYGIYKGGCNAHIDLNPAPPDTLLFQWGSVYKLQVSFAGDRTVVTSFQLTST